MAYEQRLREVKDDLRNRLRDACSHFSDKEFEELVHKMAVADPRAWSLDKPLK